MFNIIIFFNLAFIYRFTSLSLPSLESKNVCDSVAGGYISIRECCPKKIFHFFKILFYSSIFILEIQHHRTLHNFSNLTVDFLWHGMKILWMFGNFRDAPQPQHPSTMWL